MGVHTKDKCVKCGSTDRVTLVTWFEYKGTKGHYLCRKHEKEEIAAYRKTEINE